MRGKQNGSSQEKRQRKKREWERRLGKKEIGSEKRYETLDHRHFSDRAGGSGGVQPLRRGGDIRGVFQQSSLARFRGGGIRAGRGIFGSGDGLSGAQIFRFCSRSDRTGRNLAGGIVVGAQCSFA